MHFDGKRTRFLVIEADDLATVAGSIETKIAEGYHPLGGIMPARVGPHGAGFIASLWLPEPDQPWPGLGFNGAGGTMVFVGRGDDKLKSYSPPGADLAGSLADNVSEYGAFTSEKEPYDPQN